MKAGRSGKGSSLLFRRSPCLISYWRERQIVVENFADRAGISIDETAFQVLDFFDVWRSVNSLIQRYPEFDPGSLRTTVRDLFRLSFLMRADQPLSAPTQAMEQWNRWNPAAGYFHIATKDIPFDDGPVADEYLKRKAKRVSAPSSIKKYKGAKTIALPSHTVRGEFAEVLLERRTWRRFARRPIPQEALGTLLQLTWGIQSSTVGPGREQLPLKTSPSGGARHSIEAYVLVHRVEGLPKGLFHYAPDRHELELLRRSHGRNLISRYLPAQRWFTSAAALVFMTSVFERVQWKYEFARAYRVVLAEAGHLCQTFCLTATWLRLAPFCTMALADTAIEKDIGVDGIRESVLYVAGVGARPKAAWSSKQVHVTASDDARRRPRPAS